eukprot:7275798-Pyramimonas_sp.AAC.1
MHLALVTRPLDRDRYLGLCKYAWSVQLTFWDAVAGASGCPSDRTSDGGRQSQAEFTVAVT